MTWVTCKLAHEKMLSYRRRAMAQVSLRIPNIASHSIEIRWKLHTKRGGSGPTGWLRRCIWANSWQNQQNDCALSEDLDQPGHLPSLIRVFALWAQSVAKDPIFLHADRQRRLWSDWADAQADLSLRWAHMPFCWFCHAAAYMKDHYTWHEGLFSHETHVVVLFPVNDSIGRDTGQPARADRDTGQPARADSSGDNPRPSTSAFSPVIRPSRPEQMRPDSSTMVTTFLASVNLIFGSENQFLTAVRFVSWRKNGFLVLTEEQNFHGDLLSRKWFTCESYEIKHMQK